MSEEDFLEEVKTCTRCGRVNLLDARYCDQCSVIFPPFPPIPEPAPTAVDDTKEVGRILLALAFLGGTVLAAYLKLPDLLVGILGGGATSASSYYFGAKMAADLAKRM